MARASNFSLTPIFLPARRRNARAEAMVSMLCGSIVSKLLLVELTRLFDFTRSVRKVALRRPWHDIRHCGRVTAAQGCGQCFAPKCQASTGAPVTYDSGAQSPKTRSDESVSPAGNPKEHRPRGNQPTKRGTTKQRGKGRKREATNSSLSMLRHPVLGAIQGVRNSLHETTPPTTHHTPRTNTSPRKPETEPCAPPVTFKSAPRSYAQGAGLRLPTGSCTWRLREPETPKTKNHPNRNSPRSPDRLQLARSAWPK